jgi:hypothetical protein
MIIVDEDLRGFKNLAGLYTTSPPPFNEFTMELICPLPLQYEQIVMAHGGGRLMQQLLVNVVQPAF